MQTPSIELSDVIYNAATQSFEALVTVHDGKRARTYACDIDAPITMSFKDAAAGLAKQARRRDVVERGLRSERRRPAPAQRAGRPAFDPIRWLQSIAQLPGRRVA